MLESAVSFFPFFTCFVWGVVMLFSHRKGSSRILFSVLFLVASVSFLADAYNFTQLNSHNEYKVFIITDILSEFTTLMILPLLVINMLFLKGTKFNWTIAILTLQPAVYHGISALVVYLIIGIDDAALFYQAFDNLGGVFPPEYDNKLFHTLLSICTRQMGVLLLIEFVGVLSYLTYSVKKHNEKKLLLFISMLFVLMVICGARLLVGRPFILSHSGFSAVLQILITINIVFIGYMGLEFRGSIYDSPSLASAKGGVRASEVLAAEEKSREEWPQPVTASPIASSSDTSKPKNLLESFIVYMSKESPYLDPDFSVMDVCEALHTNRTYISELMAEHFKMPFRDYVGILRVSVAKRLLKDDPGRTLEDIASDSGFASSSQFVKKFKEITGTTPRAWLAGR